MIQDCHYIVQPCYKVVAMLEGCYNLVTILSQGCYNFSIWIELGLCNNRKFPITIMQLDRYRDYHDSSMYT